MEILQILLSFLAQEFGGKFSNIAEVFKNGKFDIKSLLQNVNPQELFSFISNIFGKTKTFSQESFSKAEGLSPIKNIADEKIVDSLNCYFESSIWFALKIAKLSLLFRAFSPETIMPLPWIVVDLSGW